MGGKPSDAATTTPAKPTASEEDLDAAAEIIQAAALGSPEPAPVASASALQSQKDAERYDPIVASQLEALKELYKLMDVNNDGNLQASELMTVVSQYTGSVFKENEFFNWYNKHGASSMQGVDGQVSLKEFGWYMADVALTFGEADDAKSALPTIIKAFKKLASGRTPLLSAIFSELDVTGRHAQCWP
jgi:Ca2+-binding EF-hand superfamily protein